MIKIYNFSLCQYSTDIGGGHTWLNFQINRLIYRRLFWDRRAAKNRRQRQS